MFSSEEKNNMLGQVKVPLKAALSKKQERFSMPIINPDGNKKGTINFEITVVEDGSK